MRFSSNKTTPKPTAPVEPVVLEPGSLSDAFSGAAPEEHAPVTERQPETPPEPEPHRRESPEPSRPEPSQAEQLRAAHARAAAVSGDAAVSLAHALWRGQVEPALIRIASEGGPITAIRWDPGSVHPYPNTETLQALVTLTRARGFRAALDSMGMLLVDFGP